MPSSIRKALNELPITLDDTYERILQDIPREKSQHACRLFQCMVVARRPLYVAELAEMFTIDFGPSDAPNLVAGWRPENPEEAVLSTCSTLIAIIIDEKGSEIVQFSHFSVKEFLTSDRLQTSGVGNIRLYHVALEPAHAILARACVAVLVQIDEKMDEEHFETIPLTSYAAQNWWMHARFEDVESRIQDSLMYLFNPKKPRFRRWYSNYARHVFAGEDLQDRGNITPLYCAVFCGLSRLAKHLIVTHAEDVNADCYRGWSPLHAASRCGYVDSARILLNHGAHVNAQNVTNWTPLHSASYRGHVKVAQLLLEHEADLNARNTSHETPLYLASEWGLFEVVQLLLDHGADVNARTRYDWTPFQAATRKTFDAIAQLLLERGAKRE